MFNRLYLRVPPLWPPGCYGQRRQWGRELEAAKPRCWRPTSPWKRHRNSHHAVEPRGRDQRRWRRRRQPPPALCPEPQRLYSTGGGRGRRRRAGGGGGFRPAPLWRATHGQLPHARTKKLPEEHAVRTKPPPRCETEWEDRAVLRESSNERFPLSVLFSSLPFPFLQHWATRTNEQH